MSVKGRFYQVSHAKRQRTTSRKGRWSHKNPKVAPRDSERRQAIEEQEDDAPAPSAGRFLRDARTVALWLAGLLNLDAA